MMSSVIQICPSFSNWSCVCVSRDTVTVSGAAEMSGATDGHESSAAAGPAGFLQEEGRDRERIFTQPGEARRTFHGQDTQHQGPPAVQVSACVKQLLHNLMIQINRVRLSLACERIPK